jgi:broad specificity phosphatase PhoE
MGCGAGKQRGEIAEPMDKSGQPREPHTGPGLYLVRNAASVYDHWSKNYSLRAKTYKGEPKPESDASYKFLEEVKTKWDLRLVDVGLHKNGVQEAIEAREQLTKMNVRYVFVSPLRRALETSRKVLEGLPNKSKLKIFVHPLLRPMLSNAKDIPLQTLAKTMPEYEALTDLKYDFTLVKEAAVELGELYFLESMNSPEKEAMLAEVKARGKPEEYPQAIVDVAMKKHATAKKKMRSLETFENVRRRAVKFGEYLHEFVQKASLQPNEDVLIFTHGNIVRYCVSVFWTPDGRSSAPTTHRCSPIFFNYAKLLELEKDFASNRKLRTGLTQQLMPGGGIVGKGEKIGYTMPMQTCAKGHELFFSKNCDKGEGYDCVKCLHNGKTADGRWHCLSCNYDLCPTCKPAPSAADLKKCCQRGHPLEELPLDSDVLPKFTCSRCHKDGETKVGQTRPCCLGCCYDVCPNCA